MQPIRPRVARACTGRKAIVDEMPRREELSDTLKRSRMGRTEPARLIAGELD